MLLGGVIVAVILVPTIIAAISAASGIPAICRRDAAWTLEVRPPPPSLESMPVAGPKLHAAWAQAANDFPAFLKENGQQVKDFSRWLLGRLAACSCVVLLLMLAVILAAVCLAYAKGLRAFFIAVFARITGTRQQGEHIMDIIAATVRSVANGVIGVAFVQALLVGIGFFVAGVPGAGLLVAARFHARHRPGAG